MKTGKNIQVAIADDHSLLRSALAKLINGFEGYNVILEADNGRDLVAKLAQSILPDIVLLDVNMPEMDGVAFVRQQMTRHPVPIIIISVANPSGEQVLAAARFAREKEVDDSFSGVVAAWSR